MSAARIDRSSHEEDDYDFFFSRKTQSDTRDECSYNAAGQSLGKAYCAKGGGQVQHLLEIERARGPWGRIKVAELAMGSRFSH